jgi:PadR family transcriptional regulator, regulatory protein PadR
MTKKRAAAATLARLRVLRAMLNDPDGQHYGLSLMRSTGVGAGSLYPILVDLEARGWIAGEWEDIDQTAARRRKRRYYRLTDGGKHSAHRLLAETVAELTPPDEARVAGPWLSPA